MSKTRRSRKPIEITITRFERVCVWFTALKPDPVRVIMLSTGKEDTDTASLEFSFDYEKLPGDEWKFYINMEMAVKQVAAICVRTGFSLTCSDTILFTNEILCKMIELALQTCGDTFNEYCKNAGITYDRKMPDTAEIVKEMADHAYDDYFNLRKKDDEVNVKFKTTPGLHLTKGTLTDLAVKGTIMIMDEIMFLNHEFNTAKNRETIMKIIPLQNYYTLKMKCFKLDEGELQFTWLQTVYFIMCVDCTLQLLPGEHYEKLKQNIERKGFDTANIKKYIDYATTLAENLKENIRSSGQVISILKEYDWNNLVS